MGFGGTFVKWWQRYGHETAILFNGKGETATTTITWLTISVKPLFYEGFRRCESLFCKQKWPIMVKNEVPK